MRVKHTCSPVRGSEVRLCVLGNIQRGGPPSACDRLLAARYAEAAWDALTADPPRSGLIGPRQGRFVLQAFGDTPAHDSSDSTPSEYQLQKIISRW
jgi:6-phosphofructokinase